MPDDELLHAGKIIRLVRRRYTSPEGKPLERECVLHPGAVAVVPLIDAEQVCLIRNRRITVEKTLIEIPAGTLEPGEDPDRCAIRELEEETGYVTARLEKLATFYLSPGILNERMHVYAAHDLRPGPAHREANEQIENLVVPWNEALRMIDCGEIEDGKTVAALLLVDRIRHRG